jgi:hypothetical protein
MKKITIKNLVDFRDKSERSRLTFINSFKKDKKINPDESGGDYWVSCISAINNVFITDDASLLDKKVEELQSRVKETEYKNTKDRWQKNINILEGFRDFDYKSIKPSSKMSFHKKRGLNSIMNIEGLPIESKPQHVFSYTNNESKEIGAVWFLVKKHGYRKSELGMFCDIIHRNLTEHYSDKYKVNPAFCIAVDAYNFQYVSYLQLLKGDIPYLLDNTIDEFKKLL